MLNRIALNLLKQDKSSKRGVKGKCLKAAWNHFYLLKLLEIQCASPPSTGSGIDLSVNAICSGLKPRRKCSMTKSNSALSGTSLRSTRGLAARS